MVDSKLAALTASLASLPYTAADVIELNSMIVDWKGVLSDGTLVSYVESDNLTHAALSIRQLLTEAAAEFE